MATAPLTTAELEHALATLDGWTTTATSGSAAANAITKTFALPSYMAGLAFAAAVGTVAEGLDHHPDLYIGWKKVTVTFTTHDAGSQISAKDISAAAAIDALNYPRKA